MNCMNNQQVWNEVLEYVERQVEKDIVETWFFPLSLEGIDKTAAKIAVPNEFFGEWISKHYRDVLVKAFQALQPEKIGDVVFIVKPSEDGKREDDRQKEGQQEIGLSREVPWQGSRTRRGTSLNPQYTFDNFVVGASNQFAHAACLAVAESPAKAYNPLFIYGGVGLGKTHLLNSIGNYVARRSEFRIAYLTTEQFTNEVINSIRYDKMVELRRRYRNVDMLLIDDIQFLAGKERTQEEFFHTFNTLYEDQKQIVLSSDRFPKDMPTMEERLRSRFEWGLIADLQQPDMETRIAIIQKKSEQEGLALDDDVIQFLANNLKSNIRQIEGALKRLGAYASLMGNHITIAVAKNCLRDLLNTQRHVVTVADIQEIVAKRFHVKITDLKSKRRTKTLVHPRQVAMYLSRELTDASFPEIGREFGNKDHTTVMHAYRQVQKALETDSTLVRTIQSIKEEVEKS